MPHDLPVKRLRIRYEEIDSELLYKRRGYEMRCLARLVRSSDRCLVLYEPRHFADVMLLLTLLQRKGVRASVMAAPGEPDWRLAQARRLSNVKFFKEVLPHHKFGLVSGSGVHEMARKISAGDVEADVALIFTDAPVEYSDLTASKSLRLVFFHHRINEQGMPRVRRFLANATRDDYFVDGRLSNEYQLLVRQRNGRQRY